MEVPIKVFSACTNGNVELVEQLIASGLDINEPQFSTKSTPVHLASISGKRRVLKLLLRSGALVDAVDKVGRTALHHAAAWNNVRTAKDLIKFRANVNAQATDGKSPLAIVIDGLNVGRGEGFSDPEDLMRDHVTKRVREGVYGKICSANKIKALFEHIDAANKRDDVSYTILCVIPEHYVFGGRFGNLFAFQHEKLLATEIRSRLVMTPLRVLNHKIGEREEVVPPVEHDG